MQIPSRRQELLRKYEKSLFFTKDFPRHERVYGFYLLLRPILGWLKEELIKRGLEPDEAESELYLYSSKLFSEFNTSRSSIIPYLEKAIPWAASKLLKKKSLLAESSEKYDFPQVCFLQEEFYWDPFKILFEDRYVGKLFTRGEKWAISKAIAEDSDYLVSRQTVNRYLEDIRKVLNEWRNV